MDPYIAHPFWQLPDGPLEWRWAWLRKLMQKLDHTGETTPAAPDTPGTAPPHKGGTT
ncbi:hypothetical protein ACFOY2_06470 [Nonomuraea purpurea]|uniref:Uncharacterized protein n=1 Tax=Nonomuraea purpurea TaxID=1849276 RepID=A0ABV8FYR8_9ACTN